MLLPRCRPPPVLRLHKTDRQVPALFCLSAERPVALTGRFRISYLTDMMVPYNG